MFTDSHCHLNFPELSANLAQIREAMAAAKVTRALCISTTMEEFPDVHQLALDYDNFWATVGVHPDTEDMTEPSVQDLVDRAALSRVRGGRRPRRLAPAEDLARPPLRRAYCSMIAVDG